jgi:hypothetical protein
VFDIQSFKDPLRSGLIFGIVELALLLIGSETYSVLSLICYVLMSIIIGSCAFVYINQAICVIKKETNVENPLKYLLA